LSFAPWAAVLAAWMSPAVRTAAADPILTYSDVTITAETVAPGIAARITDIGTFPTGGPGIVSVLDQPLFWSRFPYTQSTLPRGFLSALGTPSGFSAVGLSAFQLRGSDATATVVIEQTIENIGTSESPLLLDYAIPGLEVNILAFEFGSGRRVFLESSASATFTTEFYRGDGTLRSSSAAFDYSLSLRRYGFGDEEVLRSDDLLGEQGLGFLSSETRDHSRVLYGGFGGERSLGVLRPGERVHLRYALTAGISNNHFGGPLVNEVGFQSLVGDPFAVSGGGSFRVRGGEVAVVPEPSGVALMGTGLVLVGAVGGLRRIRRRGDGGCAREPVEAGSGVREAALPGSPRARG
jgi:hypothetical protein